MSYLASRLTPLRTTLDTINIDRSFYFCYIPVLSFLSFGQPRLTFSSIFCTADTAFVCSCVSIHVSYIRLCARYDFKSVTVSNKVLPGRISTLLLAKFVRILLHLEDVEDSIENSIKAIKFNSCGEVRSRGITFAICYTKRPENLQRIFCQFPWGREVAIVSTDL